MKSVRCNEKMKKMVDFFPSLERLIALSGLMNSRGLIGLHHLCAGRAGRAKLNQSCRTTSE